ncbi:MAG: phage shock envelope stress response protein PspM [Cumulibacter sp.]
MTSPRKNDNLWSDLAATVVQQIADRVREVNDSYPPPRQSQAARDGSSSWPPSRDSAEDDVVGAGSRGTPADQPSRTSSQSMASLAGELKQLMATRIRMSTSQAKDYKEMLQEHAAERERKRLEAPMRKAQGSARRNKAGAVTLGVLSLGGLAGTASAAVADKPPAAVSSGIATAGVGAGAFALARRGRRYQKLADEEAQRLGAASAQAVSLRGASAYSIPLPDRTSLAYEPTRRLVTQKKALADLLPDVEAIAPELGDLAQESEEALSAYAERVIKLERAQGAAGDPRSLDAALARAVAQYEDGVDAHQKLVEAAATVLGEMSGTGWSDPTSHSMSDAADRLQGLAEGLRQVNYDIPMQRSTDEPQTPTRSQPPSSPKSRPSVPRAGRAQNRRRGLAD